MQKTGLPMGVKKKNKTKEYSLLKGNKNTVSEITL